MNRNESPPMRFKKGYLYLVDNVLVSYALVERLLDGVLNNATICQDNDSDL